MSMRRRLKRFALPVILQKLNPHWYQLSYVKRILRMLDVDCVVDIGANAGQYASELRALGYKGFILSFEPDSSVFQQLEQKTARDDRWFAYNIALGAKRGELELNIMRRSEFNSFRSPTTSESSIVADFNTVVRREKVQVHTLSEVLPPLAGEFGFSRAFLKMDTQGYDWEVFCGARDILDLIVGLQSEISVTRVYNDVPTWSDMLARYEGEGFELLNLFSVSPGFHKLSEFDCYMKRRSAAE